MTLNILRTLLLTVIAISLNVAGSRTAMSQDGQIDPTGGGQIDPTQVTQGANNLASGGGTTDRSSEGVGDLGDAITIDVTPDQRNQGFVGASADQIVGEGFVGRPGLADGASFGGGVNGAGGSNINIGSGAAGRGGGIGGTGNGFTVSRRSIRARMRPSFAAPRLSNQQVVNRFENHFALQPGSENLQRGFSITVSDRTAFLKGSVASPAESDRLVRQLRLEPGVYKIVNELQISN